MNNVFFSENGITSTQANHMANIAKELIQGALEDLNSVRFYDISVESIAGGVSHKMAYGSSGIQWVEKALKDVGEMNSFCAWVREAIKEKEQQLNNVKYGSLDSWIEEVGFTIPECPKVPSKPKAVEEGDVVNTWNIQKRNKYFTLEAMASTYGKYIHPKGAFSNARKDLNAVVNDPIVKEGTGRDLILYTRTPTIGINEVDITFLHLQSVHREYEQELNCMKAEIKNEMNKLTLKREEEYQNQLAEYQAKYDTYSTANNIARSEWSKWKTNEMERISKLKIVVPKELEEVFKRIKEACNTQG